MNHQLFMRVLHGIAKQREQTKAIGNVEPLPIRVLIQRPAFDVFHDEIRIAGFGGAATEQTANVRVIESGENLPLVAETLDDEVVVETAPDKFDRDSVLKLTVSAPRFIYRSHSAATDFAFNAIRSNVMTYH